MPLQNLVSLDLSKSRRIQSHRLYRNRNICCFFFKWKTLEVENAKKKLECGFDIIEDVQSTPTFSISINWSIV